MCQTLKHIKTCDESLFSLAASTSRYEAFTYVWKCKYVHNFTACAAMVAPKTVRTLYKNKTQFMVWSRFGLLPRKQRSKLVLIHEILLSNNFCLAILLSSIISGMNINLIWPGILKNCQFNLPLFYYFVLTNNILCLNFLIIN